MRASRQTGLLLELCAGLSFSVIPQRVMAQQSSNLATSNGRASAMIVQPIILTNINPLDFGCISVSGAGSVTVDIASRTITYTGGVEPSENDDCLASPARFDVTGDRARAYRFTVQHDVVARHTGDERVALAVFGLKGRSDNNPGAKDTGILDDSGQDVLTVGGTLLVPKDALSGRYVAKVSVNVAYM